MNRPPGNTGLFGSDVVGGSGFVVGWGLARLERLGGKPPRPQAERTGAREPKRKAEPRPAAA